MAQLVEFPLATGGSVLVEVTQNQGGPVTRGLKGAEVTERATQTFEEAVSRVKPAVEGVITQLRSLTKAPDEMHIEFGLDLHAEAGAFIAAVSTTANFTVALTWRSAGPANEQP
jgi:Trypsin-co-occurring domain 1